MRCFLQLLLLIFTALWGLLSLSCDPELAVSVWPPISHKEIEMEINKPTGILVEDDVAATSRSVEAQLSDGGGSARVSENVTLLYDQFEPVLTAVESSDGDDASEGKSEEASVAASRAYIRVACKGEDTDSPNRDFANGYLYLEGPSFSLRDAVDGALVPSGDIFGEFRDDCTVGTNHIEGSFPGYVSDADDNIVLDLQLTIRENDGIARPLRFPMILSRNGIRLLLRTPDDGDYVLVLLVDQPGILYLGTEAGFFQCVLGSDGLICDPNPVQSP